MGEDGSAYHYKGNLGTWLDTQRKAKKGTHRTYKIIPEREAQLQLLVDEGEIST